MKLSWSAFESGCALNVVILMEKGNVSNAELTTEEMGALLSILAAEYSTTVSCILRKLDAVSGDLMALHHHLSGDKSVEWTKEEDDLLGKNAELLKRWKGNESADLRRKYLQFKAK